MLASYPRTGRILLFAQPADMRKGHNGLQGLVLQAGEDPFGGDFFVFISKHRDRAKILTYDGGGLVLWYKRLEQGLFRHPRKGEHNIELDSTALTMLLDGIEWDEVERPDKWSPATTPLPTKKEIDNRPMM